MACKAVEMAGLLAERWIVNGDNNSTKFKSLNIFLSQKNRIVCQLNQETHERPTSRYCQSETKSATEDESVSDLSIQEHERHYLNCSLPSN